MRNRLVVCFVFLGVGLLGQAAIDPRPIPRLATKKFFNDGIFESGRPARTDWIGLNLRPQNINDDFERWTFDFAPAKGAKRVARALPRFQIRFLKPAHGFAKAPADAPAKLILTFQTIRENRVLPKTIKALLKKSQLVSDIVVYPPIDDGDTAIEMVLKQDAVFSPRELLDPKGRLVLDLKQESRDEG